MKHAGPDALAVLGKLLRNIRTRTVLVERRPGIFYLKGKAFLHFHEDPEGYFADLREQDDWRRFPVTKASERTKLIRAVDRVLG